MHAELGTAPRALVIGTGVVGSATGAVLGRAGYRVYGEDSDPTALAGFPGEIVAGNSSGRGFALICICVPTPSSPAGVSMLAVEQALERAAVRSRSALAAPMIAVRSTLVPGAMNDVVAPRLAQALAGAPAGLCYWPSFARERMALDDELRPRLVVMGTSDVGSVPTQLTAWFESVAAPVRFMSFEEAELAKAGTNAFNALKISYFNAVSDWARRFGGDGQRVADTIATAAEGAWNAHYGTRVGPPFGGACLPKDLDSLIASLSEGPGLDLLRAVRAINDSPLRAQVDGESA